MVDAFRSMLDELMGKERDAPLHARSNRKILFSDRDVCKFELAAVCPHRLFTNTRSDLGEREPREDCSVRDAVSRRAARRVAARAAVPLRSALRAARCTLLCSALTILPLQNHPCLQAPASTKSTRTTSSGPRSRRSGTRSTSGKRSGACAVCGGVGHSAASALLRWLAAWEGRWRSF